MHCLKIMKRILLMVTLGSLLATVGGAAAEAGANDRLQWNVNTLVGDYEQHGEKNSKWDAPAKTALEAFAHVRTDGNETPRKYFGIIATNAQLAVDSGCTDPMVRYLNIRFTLPGHEHTAATAGPEYKKVADALAGSKRPEIRKFYADLRVVSVVSEGDTQSFRDRAIKELPLALQDKQMPAKEAEDACNELLRVTKDDPKAYEAAYRAIEPILLQNWSNQAFALLIQGTFHSTDAWMNRTVGKNFSATDPGYADFNRHLDQAEAALTKAWALNPNDTRIATEMITVEQGRGKGRERMEEWFTRAMKAQPANYDACARKLNYVSPKWYGTEQDMLVFGRQCVESKDWKGRVPLILVDAHETISAYAKDPDAQKQYWKQPAVWKDIQSSFEKFFQLTPNDTAWRHNYALYAYRCEQWDAFNAQLKLIGPVHYEFFGGKEEYEKMVKQAKEHAGASK